MKGDFDYERSTLKAYTTAERAEDYKRYNTRGITIGRIVTWFQQRAIARELRRYRWTVSDTLLDIPCGTGVLGPLLGSFPFRVVASDISHAMIELGEPEYPSDRLLGCVQSDLTRPPFSDKAFDCVVCLSFMHRVPPEIKKQALASLYRLTRRIAVISCAVDTKTQRMKHGLLARIRRKHVPAPCPESLGEMALRCEEAGFHVKRKFNVLPLLSSHAILILERPTHKR